MGLTGQMRAFSLHGKLRLLSVPSQPGSKNQECDEQVGNLAPGVHGKYFFHGSYGTQPVVFPLTSLRLFLFIRCFNFTKQARELGFGMFISFFLIMCQLPTDCQRINQ